MHWQQLPCVLCHVLGTQPLTTHRVKSTIPPCCCFADLIGICIGAIALWCASATVPTCGHHPSLPYVELDSGEQQP